MIENPGDLLATPLPSPEHCDTCTCQRDDEIPICGLCGDDMAWEDCGWAMAGDVPLCHSDNMDDKAHSCYVAWTLYHIRTPEELEGFENPPHAMVKVKRSGTV